MARLPDAGTCLLAVAMAIAPGCGGSDEPQGPHPGGSSSHATASAPASQGFSPGPGPSGGGGGGGFYGGGSGGGGGGGGHRLGGIGGMLHDREVRRRAAIERAHRPPGPERLGSLGEDAQRTSDWGAATSSSHPVTPADADACERQWAQHVATTESYHTARHDGLHSATSSAAERRFLRACRSQSPELQQCSDRAYLEQHQDECQRLREADPTRREMQRIQRATREHPASF